MSHLPTLEQINSAEVPLSTAHHAAIGIGYYVLSRKEPAALDILRRSLVDSLEQAARAMGFRLVPIAALAVDNDASDRPVTFGR
jgi:hypothetical protein